MKFTAAILLTSLLLPVLSFAEDITLLDGTEYKDVTVTRVEQDGIIVSTPDGVVKLPFSQLSEEIKLVHPYKAPVAEAPAMPATAPAEITTTEPATVKPLPKATPVAASGGDLQKTGDHMAYCGVLIKAGIALAAAFLLLLVAWFAACRLLAGSSRRKEAQDFRTTTTEQFHTAYGDFFAIWKLWNYYQDNGNHELPDHGENEIPHASRWELLERTYIAEGMLDSVFLKLTSARKLAAGEVELLGRFRQGFQSLGQAIKANKSLNWKDAEHPDYLVFKRLASRVALLLGGESSEGHISDLSADAFRQITSARWERGWGSESTPA